MGLRQWHQEPGHGHVLPLLRSKKACRRRSIRSCGLVLHQLPHQEPCHQQILLRLRQPQALIDRPCSVHGKPLTERGTRCQTADTGASAGIGFPFLPYKKVLPENPLRHDLQRFVLSLSQRFPSNQNIPLKQTLAYPGSALGGFNIFSDAVFSVCPAGSTWSASADLLIEPLCLG